MNHFLSLQDFDRTDIEAILQRSRELKRDLQNGKRPALMAGSVLGLLFQKPSLRTRVSFESLATHLGANSLYLGEDVGWGKREPNCDFIPILTSYLDVLVIRAKRHEEVLDAARYSRCPIINGLTDYNHPFQALADVLTIMEHSDDLSSAKVCYVGDGNNVARSLLTVCGKLGIDCAIAAPAEYQLERDFVEQQNQASSAILMQTDDLAVAMQGAEFVYTDVWTSMGQEAESEKRKRDFASYRVDESVMRLGTPNSKFLHCLPARRGEEVTAKVIDGDRSLVIDQANNRLHAQKGLVAWLLELA